MNQRQRKILRYRRFFSHNGSPPDPHRKDMCFGFIAATLATTAICLSFLSNFWCETIAFQPLRGNGDNIFIPTRTFGPFYAKELVAGTVGQFGGEDYFVIGEKCVNLSDDISKDANWKTTQAFAIITVVIGGIMVFWTWLAPCFGGFKRFWKPAGLVYILCSIFQGLTLLFLESAACTANNVITLGAAYKQTCEWDWGTQTNISSVVFWFLAGAFMIVVVPPDAPERPPPETQTVTYTQNPDGTVAETGVVKGTYVAGGGVVDKDPEEGALDDKNVEP